MNFIVVSVSSQKYIFISSINYNIWNIFKMVQNLLLHNLCTSGLHIETNFIPTLLVAAKEQ